MTRFIRWNYVLPRLVLLVVLLVVAQFGLSYFVHHSIIASGEAVVGARFELGDTHISLLDSQLVIRDLQVADAQQPMKNLFEAERCEFNLDTAALLHRRTVVESGKLRGLRFNTNRLTNGSLSGTSAHDDTTIGISIGNSAVEATNAWINQLDSRLRFDLADQFESIRLTEELLERWPNRYAKLKLRISELKRRSGQLRETIAQADGNPLRYPELLVDVPTDIQDLQSDFLQLTEEVSSLPELVENDRRAIIAARRRDEQRLREQLRIDSLDSTVLSSYLLAQESAEPLAQVIRALRWMRELVPDQLEPTPPNRGLGHDVQFAGCHLSPDFLIRSLDLQGSARISGQPLELRGTLTNVTNEPALHGRPLRLRLTSGGSTPLELLATFDRTGPEARDEIDLECPGLFLPRMTLGSSPEISLSLNPSTALIRTRVTLIGNRLSGSMEVEQENVDLVPNISSTFDKLHMADDLRDSLSRIDKISVRIALGGTLAEPQWTLSSNLGPAVAAAIDTALKDAIESQTRDLLSHSQQTVDERLTQLERAMASQQTDLMHMLTSSSDDLRQVAETGIENWQRNPIRYGRQSPDSPLLR